jgi:hypothetical protein
VLLRVCRITSTRPHTSPQLDQRHDAFVAVERYSGGNGWFRICRHGLEKVSYSFTSSLADVDVKGLSDQEFEAPVWREGQCLRGAGGGEGMGEAEAAAGCRCVCLCLTLLLLQLMCTMPSTSRPPCTHWSRIPRIGLIRTSSPWTLKPDACRICRAIPNASSSAATHRKCMLSKSRVCRVRS